MERSADPLAIRTEPATGLPQSIDGVRVDLAQPPHARLGLWDVVSIIIGIVVGTGIYETPPLVLQNVANAWQALGLWAVCGLLSLIGALCYAELASTYPQSGGDYVYLSRAFGRWLGFLFGWAQLTVICTGSIGMLAYVFADYAGKLWGRPAEEGWLWAGAAVAALSLLNLMGVIFGKTAQNVLTSAKVIGLAGILVAGFGWAGPVSAVAAVPPDVKPVLGFALVLVFVTYGGWNDAAYVAAELRDGPRSIVRALILGTAGITLLYVLVNAAYLSALGFDGARKSHAIAADVLARPLGEWGSRAMCLLVMVSALGAVNGLIFSGPRLYARMGAEHPLFAWLGRWNRRTGVPWVAISVQAVLAMGLIVVVGTPEGRNALNGLFTLMGQANLDWEGRNGFDTMLRCTTPVFWLFFLLTGLSLFVLRKRDRGINRPFRVPLYPLLPIVFCATCVYMLYSGIQYARHLGVLGVLLVLLGVPLYLLSASGIRH
jgi:APA family basic amino acid/polyamine antiporter